VSGGVTGPDFQRGPGLLLHNRSKRERERERKRERERDRDRDRDRDRERARDYVWTAGDPLGSLLVLSCHVIRVNGNLQQANTGRVTKDTDFQE